MLGAERIAPLSPHRNREGEAERIGPYRIRSVLAEGTMGVVYRAEDAVTGQPVALKTIAGVDQAGLAGLRREIHALSTVRHEGVVRVIAQGTENGVPWLAMELHEGQTLRAWMDQGGAAVNGRLAEVLDLIARLCEPIVHIHSAGIVHGDLKPENVLVTAAGAPVLVDFGLFSHSGSATGREVLEVGGSLVGTVHYMAPERISGGLIDARADIYALGCIFYEALTGAPPFGGETAGDVLAQHLHVEPRAPSERIADIPAWLDELVLAMLRKARRERLGHADVVAATLRARLGQPPRPPEASAARSYLYRPEFIDREGRLAELDRLVHRARNGQGGLVLVGGESGIGKTRLVMEAGTTAVSCGMSALLGECVAVTSEGGGAPAGGGALHAFRPLFSFVVDRCRRGGQEEADRLLGARGQVLEPFEPAFGTLPGQRHDAPLPEVSPEAALVRLERAVVETLVAVARTTPVLLILDDLQWADELSRYVFRALQGAPLEEHRILVLGTYRSDEVDPALREIVDGPATRKLELDRLGSEGIHRMVGDMLALPEAPPALVERLFAQAEGNPFFVSEYLHAAVEEEFLYRDAAGRWQIERLGDGDEVARSIPRTVKALVGRRLGALPGAARRLVEIASVFGRSVDERLLMRAAALPEPEGMEAVHLLISRRILDRSEHGGLGFTHGKIREVAYEGTAVAARAALHAAVAGATEEHYGSGSERRPHYAMLAYHWSRAADGLPDLVDKAIGALERAALQALETNASQQAVQLFTDLLRLGGAEPAKRRARWEQGLGDVYFRLGRAEAARTHLVAALRLMGERVPVRRLALGVGLLREILRQATRRVRRIVRHDPGRLDVARTYELLGFVQLITVEQLPGLVSNLRALNAAESAPLSPVLATSNAAIGLSVGLLLGERVAEPYFARALAAARALDDAFALGRVAHVHALYLIGRGRWAEAERILDGAMAAFTRIGDGRWYDLAALTLGNLRYHHRRSGGCELFQEGERAGRERGDRQTRAWSELGLAASRLVAGAPDAALAHLEVMDAALARDLDAFADPASQLGAYGVRAAALRRQGCFVEARAQVDAAQRLTARQPLLLYYAYAGYSLIAEVSMRLWEASGGSSRQEQDRLAALAARANADLQAFARFVPIGRSQALLWRGLTEWNAGRTGQARGTWRRALATAVGCDMPYEQGLAHYEIGRHLAATDPQRAVELAQARDLFAAIGAVLEAGDAIRLLAEPTAGAGPVAAG